MADSTVNDELVSQFLAITGSADPSKAGSYLEMSGGNLDAAVSLFMDHEQGSGGGGGGGFGGGGGSGMAAAAAAAAGGDFGMPPDIRAPDATRTMRLMDDNMVQQDPSFQLMNAMMEEQLAQSAFAAPAARDVRAAVNAAARRRSRSHSRSSHGGGSGDGDDDDDEDDYHYDDDDDDNDDQVAMDEEGGEEVEVVAGPPQQQQQQSSGLSDMFAPPNHLIHRAGGFQGARAMAKDTKRWLLVNIQKDSEFSSHALNRDVWRDELVENLIREGFIFWQQMDMHPEGRTYVERYQVADYPHVGIIDPRTGRLMWRKEGWTMQNPLTSESFSEMAMDFCSRNSFDRPPQAPRPAGMGGRLPSTGSSSSSPHSNSNNKRPMEFMSEEEQLQAAMRASMQDSSKDDNSNNDDGNHSIEFDDADDRSQEQDDAKQHAASSAKPKQEEKEAAPKVSPNEEFVAMDIGDEPGDGARVQFRMPDGKRVVRKFDKTVSVKTLYAFVAQSNDEARDGKEFALMAGFPPADLVQKMDQTVGESGLAGQAVSVRWKD